MQIIPNEWTLKTQHHKWKNKEDFTKEYIKTSANNHLYNTYAQEAGKEYVAKLEKKIN